MTPNSDCDSPFVVDGFLDGAFFDDLRIVTGTTKTLVNAKCVPKSAYLGRSITLGSRIGRQRFKHQLAKLEITVGKVSVNAEVAVAKQLPCSAFLGQDLGRKMGRKLMAIVLKHMDDSDSDSDSDSDVTAVPMQSENIVVTKQQVELEVVSTTRAQPECNPEALAVVLDLPEAYSEPDVVIETHELTNELELDQNFPEDDDTPVILDDVFGFSDTLFSNDSPVDLGEVFNFSDSLFEPEDPIPTPVQVLEACPIDEAGSSYFGGDNSEVEKDCVAVQPLDDLFDFSNSSDGYDSLVGLGDVLDLVDQLFVPVQPVPSPVKILEVLPVGRTDIECPLPVLEEVVVAKCEEAYVAPVVEVAVEQFAVVMSLGGEAPVTPIDNFKFSDEFFNLADKFFEQEPAFSPDPVVQLMPAKDFIDLTLTEEGLLSTSCCQSSDLANFIKYLVRFHTKATGRLAPGRDSVSELLQCLFLRLLLFVLCCCGSPIFFCVGASFCSVS